MKRYRIWPLGILLLLALLVRVWKLDAIPTGLYWDEMDVGYQAYSLLKTGKDYFGELNPLFIHSFADYRAPLLIYITIPFIALGGLSALSVRLPAALLGVASVLLIFLLTQELFKKPKIALIAALLTAFAPWNLQYSRIAFEATLLLTLFLGGLIGFYKGLNNSRWFIVSALLFSASLFSYNTAKLFVPVILLILGVIYIRKKNLNKNLIFGGVIVGVFFLLNIFGSLFLNGGQRFSEIAVFTDPQISAEVDHLRNQSGVGFAGQVVAGQELRFVDQLLYNKVTFILDRIVENYLQVFSTDFLFVSGDPNPRHSPSRVGEFFRIESVLMLLGLTALLLMLQKSNKNAAFLLLWIVFAPLVAVITREGGTHATRLFLLWPVLSIVSAIGTVFIWKNLPRRMNLIAMVILGTIWMFSVVFYLNYYFGAYKLESARAFQERFSEAVALGLKNTDNFDYVIIDDRGDSVLMNFLFEARYDPELLQAQISTLGAEIAGFQADKFDNLYLMKPGERNWEKVFKENLIDANYLLLVSPLQFQEETVEKVGLKFGENQKLIDVITYQSGAPAFYVIESRRVENR